MKKLFTLLFAFVFTATFLYSQEVPPQAIGFSATLTDSKGHPVRNSNVFLMIKIMSSEDPATLPEYEEFHSTTVDQSGRAYIEIGRGNVMSGDFETIPWGDDEWYLSVWYAATLPGTYQHISTTQFISVPYALYSGEAGYSKEAGHSLTANEAGYANFSGYAGEAGSVVTETVRRSLIILGIEGNYDNRPDSNSSRDGTSIQLCSPTDSITPNVFYNVSLPVGATVRGISFFIDNPSGSFHWNYYYTSTGSIENTIADGSDSRTGSHWIYLTRISDVILSDYAYAIKVFMEDADHNCYLNCIQIIYEIQI